MYTKIELIQLFKQREKWDVAYNTFFFWQRKGYITTEHTVPYVGRTIPVYDEEDYKRIVLKLKALQREGKVRIKIIT